eukprot:3326050-Pyramimonas_sp.AAC.1
MTAFVQLVPSSLKSAPQLEIAAILQIRQYTFTKIFANISATHDFEHVLTHLREQIIHPLLCGENVCLLWAQMKTDCVKLLSQQFHHGGCLVGRTRA